MPHIFKKVVASLDEVPAPFHPLYTKGDNGFAMADEAFAQVDPAGYQSALDKERGAAKAATKALEAWKPLGEDPTIVAADLAKWKEEAAKKDSTAGQFEKYKAEVADLHAKALAAKDEALKTMQGTLESHMIHGEAATILAGEKGSPALLMPIIERSVKVLSEGGKYVVRVVDAEGDPRISAQTGQPVTLKEFVNELKAHPEYGKAFDASGQQGSGTRPGAAGTPRQQDSSKLSPTEKIARGLAAVSR